MNRFLAQLVLLASGLMIALTSQLLAASSTLLASESSAQQVPCWFNSPAPEGVIGALGLARNLDVGAGAPSKLSRFRALQSVSDFFSSGDDTPTLSDDNNWQQLDLSQVKLIAGQPAYSSNDFVYDGYVYSYVQLGQQPSEQHCPLQQCDLAQCQPAWLCQPSSKKGAGFLGVSDRASTLPEQYAAALDNAVAQLVSVYGLNIEAQDRIYSAHTSSGSLRVLLSDETISAQRILASDTLRYKVSDSCRLKSQLFQRIVFPDLPGLSSVTPEQWLREPNSAGHLGAIGSVHGRVASGLLSDKLQLAIRRGLLALAKAKHSTISETLWTIEQRGSHYQLSLINQSTQVMVFGRVNGLHFSPGVNGVAVDAWLVETQPDHS